MVNCYREESYGTFADEVGYLCCLHAYLGFWFGDWCSNNVYIGDA